MGSNLDAGALYFYGMSFYLVAIIDVTGDREEVAGVKSCTYLCNGHFCHRSLCNGWSCVNMSTRYTDGYQRYVTPDHPIDP